MKPRHVFFLLLMPSILQAQVITDGSFSVNSDQLSVNSDGEYAITRDLGKTAGHNLFHSFHTFNVGQGETAVFSGEPHIENVISRVTGGSPSHINGTIQNKIPAADTYLINPAGIMFGEHAQLDVQGSFYVSTAAGLKFSDGAEFSAAHPQASRLSIARPVAFGFEAQPASLSVQGSTLTVPAGRRLDVSGGAVTLHAGATQKSSPGLYAAGGRVRLISLGQGGDIPLSQAPDQLPTSGGGSLHMKGPLRVDVSSGGHLSLFGDEIILDKAELHARILDNTPGGHVDIRAGYLHLRNGATVDGDTWGAGNGAHIRVSAEHIRVEGNPPANAAQNPGPGNRPPPGGDRKQPEWSGFFVRSGNADTLADEVVGDAGRVELRATNIEFGGEIILHAGELRLLEGAHIEAGSVAQRYPSGRGGSVLIQVRGKTVIEGFNPESPGPVGGSHQYPNSGVYAASVSSPQAAGAANDIELHAHTLILRNGGVIRSDTNSLAAGGNIRLFVDALEIDGQVTQQLRSGIYADSSNTAEQAGRAGDIHIQAETIHLHAGATVSSAARNAGGGDIDIHLPGLLYLHKSQITTSVHGGDSDGGNIRIDAPRAAVLNQSGIKAQADAGQGGNIQITTDTLLKATDSVISASSRLGIDGRVEIESPTEDLNSSVFIIQGRFLQEGGLALEHCDPITSLEELSTYKEDVTSQGQRRSSEWYHF